MKKGQFLHDGAYTGFLSERANYKAGKLVDSLRQSFFENNKLYWRANYIASKICPTTTNICYNGLVEYYFEDGQLKERSNWKVGKKDGLFMEYYAEGTVKEKSNWKAGERDGLTEKYYGEIDQLMNKYRKKGEIWSSSNWKAGKRID
ncbi:hypothetical protein N9390_05255 [Gammaproteobacteria bacterium]|nr:hypothetical protein [Gammaproteobacteria bacterium]